MIQKTQLDIVIGSNEWRCRVGFVGNRDVEVTAEYRMVEASKYPTKAADCNMG